jgi:RNA polymerase sigma-70 factor (ECF subfamily)
MDLAGLVDSCRHCQPEGWRALFESYASVLYHALRSRGASHELAEDIVADVFLKLMENEAQRIKSASFANDRHLQWWLVTIARNQLLDRVRRDQALPFTDGVEDQRSRWTAGLRGASENASEDMIDQISDRLAMEEALLSLTPRERYFTRLYYYEGFKYREIAEIAGVTTGAVASLIARAKGKLRKSLKQFQVTDRFPSRKERKYREPKEK